MHEAYEDKGLTVLAVTRDKEPRDKTAAWIEQTGAEFPYAYAKDNALYEAVGVKGIPHACLVDPSGTIVWSGHPSRLDDGLVEEHLKGASKFISYGWSEEFEKVAKAIGESEFADAFAEVQKLAADGVEGAADVEKAVAGMLAARLEPMNEAMEKGDYYAAYVVADGLDGKLKGLEEEATVDDVLTKLKKDKEVKEIFGGQKKLQKIVQGELRKSKQVEQAIDKAARLAKKYEGTIVETQALEFVDAMKERLRKM